MNLKNYVTTKTTGTPPAWSHIPAEKVTALTAHYDAWHTAFVATVGPHTSVQTEAKNDARKEAEAFVRPFVAQYLKFDPVTDEDGTKRIRVLCLGVFAVRKLHEISLWSFGKAETPRQFA